MSVSLVGNKGGNSKSRQAGLGSVYIAHVKPKALVMAIKLRRIVDRTSFLSETAAPRTTSAMYFFKQLDPFYDMACAVAKDLFDRPHLYTGLNDQNIVRTLAILHSRKGTDELIPSFEQRVGMYSPVFGQPNRSENFDKLRDDLIAACTAFSERVFDTGVEMLRERVRTSHRPLKDYLLALTGDSTEWSVLNPLDNIAEKISFTILRSPGVGTIFGVGTPPKSSWPYSEDSNADKLLAEISGRLSPKTGLNVQQASNRQRLAARGAEALTAVIDYAENSANRNDDNASLNILITQCYTWGAAKNAREA
jgi:hypothetical protein